MKAVSKEKDKKVHKPAAEGSEAMPTEPTEAGTPAEEKAPPAGPSTEEALAASQAEAAKNWDLYLRARADLENYRKRAQREKEDLARFANEKIIREILPVMDNLERALEHARQGKDNDEGLVQGVEMTLSQLRKVLEKFGATPFDSVGEPFDPARHEALGQVESSEHPPNTVVQELHKGYLLNDRLLRPALVMVAKASAAQESPPGDD